MLEKNDNLYQIVYLNPEIVVSGQVNISDRNTNLYISS